MRILSTIFQSKKYSMVAALLFLITCTITETLASDLALVAQVAKSPDELGYVTGYNELCTQFRRTGAVDKIVQEFKRKFAKGPAFEQGYDKLSHYRVYDSLSGLDQCPEMRVLIESVHKFYVEGRGTNA